MTDVESILWKVESLPPLPTTSVQLMTVIGDPGASMEDIVDVIKYDQALTGEILRLCNSAYFGLSRQVTSLNDAMICLGTVKVLQLVMSVHASAVLGAAQEGYGLGSGELWRHSVATALASARCAQRIKLPNVNLAFTAGLLHDIGKVVLSEYVAEEFTEIIRRVTDEKLSFIEAERQVLNFDHTQIGARIAEQWKLPDKIVACIRYHHEPSELNPADPLVDTVYLANCVCLMLGVGLGTDGLCYRADESVTERHDLNEHDLEAISMSMLNELQSVSEMFDEHAPDKNNKVACRQARGQ